MKKIALIIVSAILFAACGPTKDEVININDQFVNKIKKCTNAESAFYKVCSTYDQAKISAELKTFIEVNKSVKAEVVALEVHKDLDKLKSSAELLVDEYIRIEADFKEYARLYSIPSDSFTDADVASTKTITEKINNELDTEFKDFQLTQDEFAAKYKYTISKASSKENK
jgi:hypothetical protein